MPKLKEITREEKTRRRTEVALKARRGELKLPEAIREIRLSLGYTQAVFAEKFGFTRAQVIDLESGKANPTVKTLDKIGKLFGFEVGFVPKEGKQFWKDE